MIPRQPAMGQPAGRARQLWTLAFLALLAWCFLISGTLVVFAGPGLAARWRGDATVTGAVSNDRGDLLVHQPLALVVGQPDGRTYRVDAETDFGGWFRVVVPAAALAPGPASAYLEAQTPDGTVWWVDLDLRGGETLRGRWQLAPVQH